MMRGECWCLDPGLNSYFSLVDLSSVTFFQLNQLDRVAGKIKKGWSVKHNAP